MSAEVFPTVAILRSGYVMAQVFLSHSKIDADFALRLANDLRSAGIPVWKAPESIFKGENWVEAIQRGLTTSTHMLLLQSPAAVQSEWVKFEFNAALTLEKEGKICIIPIDYQPCKLPLFWGMFQQVSSIDSEYHSALLLILARLAEEQPISPPQPTLSTSTINKIGQDNISDLLTRVDGSNTYAGQPAKPPAIVIETYLKPIQTRNLPEIEIELIPAGSFFMGSSKSDKLRFENEPEEAEVSLEYMATLLANTL
jgi:hypothetical protein